jgi:hypothetical protein
MGISLGTALGIIVDVRKRNICGRVLTLGKQDCSFTFNELLMGMSQRGMLALNGNVATVSAPEKAVLDEFQANGRLLAPPREDILNKNYVSDEFFFRFIGFDSILSVDHAVDGGTYEGASVAFDLNDVGLREIVGQNQLVYDGGTIEHIFNTANVLRNIFDSLAVGGYVFHNSPTNNMVDHGFYQFSPTFFFDYYATNGYGDIEVYLARGYAGRYDTRGDVERLFGSTGSNLGHRLRYERGLLNQISHGGLDSAVYHTECYAKKLASTTFDRVPQQGVYVPLWDASGERADAPKAS